MPFPLFENFSSEIIQFGLDAFAPVDPWFYPFIIVGIIGFIYGAMESITVTTVAILVTFGIFATTTSIFEQVPAINILFYIISILGLAILITTAVIRSRRK